jgi:hypothetical protein
MSRFQFELATADDDQALRRLMAETPMPGSVSVTFRREPSFFEATVVDGRFRQVIVARDRATWQIAGVGCRSVRNMYVNGRARPVGYLSSLRILEQHRGTAILARGYAYLRQLHGDGRAGLYLTTIAEGNDRAISLLTSRRAGLPSYHEAGNYYTLVVPLTRQKRGHSAFFAARDAPRVPGVKKVEFPLFLPGQTITVRPMRAGDAEELVAFLGAVGAGRQFFPDYSAHDFFTEGGTFKDLRPSDVLSAYRRGEMVGVLAAWNQRSFRQTVIEGYSGRLRWMRGLYNGWARLSGRPRLPAPGCVLRYVTAAIPAVHDGDPEVFTALLRSLIARLAPEPHDFLLVGLHENDPLLPTARRFSVNAYVTRLYLVCWADGEPLRAELDPRPPYLELGCL